MELPGVFFIFIMILAWELSIEISKLAMFCLILTWTQKYLILGLLEVLKEMKRGRIQTEWLEHSMFHFTWTIQCILLLVDYAFYKNTFFSGYMSPEYAVDGLFSVKSDVFSFGVMVLEIVSRKRNRGFIHQDHSLNLLGHVSTVNV